MKRFIVSVLCVSVFFIGLEALVEKAGATFKSDEKALELLAKARRAIGGEAAIGNVRSMTIAGKVTKTFEIDGAARSENGEVEINFELPNKMTRQMKLGSGDASALGDKQIDVLVMKEEKDNVQFRTENPEAPRKIIVKKVDGTEQEINVGDRIPFVIRKDDGNTIVSEDGKAASDDDKRVVVRRLENLLPVSKIRSNELFRTTLALLLSAPEGMDVSYTYAGEGSVDGVSCDIIAANDGGSTLKLYLDKSTSLPRMMTYQGPKQFMIRIDKDRAPVTEGDTKIFTRTMKEQEIAEFQVKFSDFRSVGGLQLPHRWTQTIAGKDDEVIDITAFEINPANIAEKFKEIPVRTFVRTRKEQ